MRFGILAVGLALLSAFAPAQAAETQTGMIVARASGGFWARFAQPVREGQTVGIRAFLVGESVGTARVEWASPVAPYEAFLVDVKVWRSARSVSMRTPYQALVGDRTPGYYEDREIIAPGYYVAAERAETRPVLGATDPLAVTVALLATRAETRELAEQLGSGHLPPLPEVVFGALQHRRFAVWEDPVALRLVGRLLDVVMERGAVGGRVPGGWFPPALAKQKPQESN